MKKSIYTQTDITEICTFVEVNFHYSAGRNHHILQSIWEMVIVYMQLLLSMFWCLEMKINKVPSHMNDSRPRRLWWSSLQLMITTQCQAQLATTRHWLTHNITIYRQVAGAQDMSFSTKIWILLHKCNGSYSIQKRKYKIYHICFDFGAMDQ